MAQNVENVQRGFAIVPVGEHTNEKNEQRKRQNQKKVKTVTRKPEESNFPLSENAGMILDNMNLKFSFNKETGETEVSVENGATRVSREVQFDEVTKANEQVFERRGIVFDKRA